MELEVVLFLIYAVPVLLFVWRKATLSLHLIAIIYWLWTLTWHYNHSNWSANLICLIYVTQRNVARFLKHYIRFLRLILRQSDLRLSWRSQNISTEHYCLESPFYACKCRPIHFFYRSVGNTFAGRILQRTLRIVVFGICYAYLESFMTTVHELCVTAHACMGPTDLTTQRRLGSHQKQVIDYIGNAM